jgi:hypothetical protein
VICGEMCSDDFYEQIISVCPETFDLDAEPGQVVTGLGSVSHELVLKARWFASTIKIQRKVNIEGLPEDFTDGGDSMAEHVLSEEEDDSEIEEHD